jgi:hypothetical protein
MKAKKKPRHNSYDWAGDDLSPLADEGSRSRADKRSAAFLYAPSKKSADDIELSLAY